MSTRGGIPHLHEEEKNVSEQDGLGLFAGGQRAHKYDDPATTTTAEPQAAVDEAEEAEVIRHESVPPPPGSAPATEAAPMEPVEPVVGELVPTRPAEVAPAAPGVWQRFLIRVGAAEAPPTAQELEDRENERIVRQSTWTRAMSAVVANPKGGSTKTPLSLLLAGAIADIRGGGVAAWEATEVPGDLSDIAEGSPPRGLTELIAAGETVTSAGTLAGYTAPQTSHAAVIGSVSARAEISPEEITAVRALLGTYYQVDIADTANNLQRPSLRELLKGADAVVIPCVISHKSVRGLQRALTALESVPGLRGRAVLVVSHDGGPEDAGFAASLIDNLMRHYAAKAIVELPYDPAIRADGELTYSSLQPSTRYAMRTIARHVIECFNAAPPVKSYESE